MKKKILNLLYIFTIILSFIALGCGNMTEWQNAVKVNKQEKNVSKEYQRVVSISVSSDEIIMDLLPAEKIAGISASSLRPELGNSLTKAKQIKNTVDINSLESILRVQPDLVVIPSFVREEVRNSLKDMGINIFVYPKQNSFEEIRQSIRGIAHELGKDPQPLLNYMDKRIAALDKRLQLIPANKRKRIVYLMNNGIYANPHSPFQDICKYAGVTDAAMELGYTKKTFLSKEQMVKLNPDAILVADFNWDGESETKAKIDNILNDEAYRDVKAVQNKQVFAIPGAHIYALSHYIIGASEDVAKAVYPELFKN